MRNRTVLISGAGIAGPSLAFWLARHGFQPTVVERATAPRRGGQAVDFRGQAQLRVLAGMGVLETIRRRAIHAGPVSFVDESDRRLATMSAEVASGDVEILRGDLGQVFVDATRESTEYIFDDSITALEETGSGVHVAFQRSAPRSFDLVIGADGMHSTVRALAFGPDSRYVHHLGHYVAISSARNVFGDEAMGRLYSLPGRTAGIFTGDGRARTIFYFASDLLAYDRRSIEQQKTIVAGHFANMGWETPRLVTEMHAAADFYFDSIAEVRMPTAAAGRIALIGDAAFGGTLGGMGTGAAVIAAYVLAGELAASDGDHLIAFNTYEARIRAYATRCQRGARTVGGFMAPRTALGIRLRNLSLDAMNVLPGKGLMERVAMKRADGIKLENYPLVA